MADCITPAALSDIAQKDSSRLVGQIAKALAANSPFINVIGGGTFPSGVSDEIRTSVQQQAAPGDSLALPTFVCDTELCGTVGNQDLTDAIDFTARLESKRGFGPRVCVKKGYAAFKTSYLAAEDSLKKLMTQYINSDVRAQLYLRSASKFVAAVGWDFNSLFTGGNETDVGVKFAPITPTAPISFKALHAIARYLKEALFAEMFDAGGKGMPHFRFIGSSDIIEAFRNEIGVKDVLCCLTTGGYKLGEVAVSAYSFEQAPAYRGIAFGTDQRPLRSNGFNEDGTLNLIDPVITVVNTCKNTAYAKANPAWLTARNEVGFLFADNSFNRLTPERYTGEGTFKFAPQLFAGELDWHYVIDNDCNVFGDFGWHTYQITRAYQPVRPQHIVPILYQRCLADLGLEICDPASASSYSGADSFATLGVCEAEDCNNPGGCIDPAESLGQEAFEILSEQAAEEDPDGPAEVSLGAASDFGILGASTVTNTGATVVDGDLGLSPGTAVTGFPPGTVLGTQHVTDIAAANAQLALTAAYLDAESRAGAIFVSGNIGGTTLFPGLYKSNSTLAVSSGDLTLDAQGDPNAVFIFQVASTLTLTPGRQIILAGGAQASKIFWQVGSSATLQTTSIFKGTIMALTSITAETGATVDGRLLARNGAVTLDTNPVTVP